MTTSHQYVLVTGANSGLGLGICCRLIDEFLDRAQPDQKLTIIYTTRSSRKASDTLTILERHLAKHGNRAASNRQVFFQPENVDLGNLLSIRALSRKLVASDLPHLNSIVLNAGIGGWSGLDWITLVWLILTQIRQATTWPVFKRGIVGLVTKPQFPQDKSINHEEPVLGEVFCANVFGHYMLVHWMMALLRATPSHSPGKIIWTSSIEPGTNNYNPEDHQGLTTDAAYEHSKRLTDSLALTANGHPSTAASVKEYTTVSASTHEVKGRHELCEPTFHLGHPGVCVTSIVDLYFFVTPFYFLGLHLARMAGSVWANVTTYKGAFALSWLALATTTEIESRAHELTGSDKGMVKWGSATARSGKTTVNPTEVQGWGLNGSGTPFTGKWWAGSVGRKFGAKDATKEDVENFVSTGAIAWSKMEALRKEWEARVEAYEIRQGKASNGSVS
ncbi:hypothetical protein LTR84_005216 [Exophiala bonariae]|uniref:3-keto-steroid reductase n=1 Tax=Exophiala bonariae TaxID=1690606 RepID=A0AAV9NSU5_9EURO|nr:hypothetical protein LTR84_005216 [Exophiala bonariae]